MKSKLLCVALCAAAAAPAHASDFGEKVELLAKVLSPFLFGSRSTLDASSSSSVTAEQANANPKSLATVAPGLQLSVVSANAALGPNTDMMALWPNDKTPTHLIACNEEGAAQVGVQRIELATGAVANIISSGLSSCDPVRITPWGTVLVGEEAGANGRVFEIIDPLNTTGVVVTGSGAGTTISDPHVVRRGAVGQLSFEGLALLPNGVLYMSDEKRPGNGNPGGAIFKFVPATLWTGTAPIADLSQSPLTSGSLYAMRVGRRSGSTDFGQGNEFGRGVWVQLAQSSDAAPTNLGSAAIAAKATHYYRPEDMDLDRAELAAGSVRFCGANTGEDGPGGDNHFGEVYCVRDGTIAEAATVTLATQTAGGVTYTLNSGSVPEYQPLVIGNVEFGMMDNIAYQPRSGNWLVQEDGSGSEYTPPRNNDIWSCVDDGKDEDNLADACARVITLNDLLAESTGGVFNANGSAYYFSVQHNVTGHGVILKVTGWRNID